MFVNHFNFGAGAIARDSKKQNVMALYSEVEYVAVTSAACQAIWLRRFLVNIHE